MHQWAEGSKKYRIIGFALTILWLALVTGYLMLKSVNPLDLKPNEFGDFLAGILGPLGILWIILGFWQQGDELRSSVEALRLQSDELRNSVAQQEKLVEVTREQLQSEIEAARAERNERYLSRIPDLHIVYEGGQISGQSVISRLIITNSGGDALDVTVNHRHSSRATTIPIISEKQSSRLAIQFDRSDSKPIEIIVHYKTFDSRLGEAVFTARKDSDVTSKLAIHRQNDSFRDPHTNQS